MASTSPNEFDIASSRCLCWLLRHFGPESGIIFTDDGYCSIEDACNFVNRELRVELIPQKIVDFIVDDLANKKRRRYLLNADKTMIAAREAHTYPFPDLGYKQVNSVEDADVPSYAVSSAKIADIMRGGIRTKNGILLFRTQTARKEGTTPADRDALIYLNVERCFASRLKMKRTREGIIILDAGLVYLHPKFLSISA